MSRCCSSSSRNWPSVLRRSRLAVVQRGDLIGVVRVDRLLDRHRASHRRAFAQRRGRRAEREAGEMPQRQHRGRAHAATHDQVGEPIQVLPLLFLHLAQHRGCVAAAQHRELAGIDPCRAILPGVVDADHARDRSLGVRIAGQMRSRVAHASLLDRATGSRRAPARIPGRRAGSSRPSKSAGRGSGMSASSHGLAGRAGMFARRSAIEPPVKRGAAHSGSGLGQ